jgi:hypothetical protein
VLGRIALLIERVDSLATYTDPRFAVLGEVSALTPPFVVGAVILAGLLALKFLRPPRATG